MKAISLWQPWATLCVIGAKRFETRHWQAYYRGPILIHAAKKWDRSLAETCAESPFVEALNGRDIPRGAIVGRVNLVACLRTEIVRGNLPPGCDELEFGDFYDGRFAWQLDNPVVFPVPIPYRGSQGFFDVPAEVVP